ncbi:hsp90 protein domain-containing protein [Ditylenchus destructor]|uniref:Hsp90 protein domain-containing protein n=1 Tax=Ditylenchus destructor TaxID=166010 RepID=A0AAD4NLA5_9BILA|nr:hsp90 protein domain-containing protein [Ditylenchus destructor]
MISRRSILLATIYRRWNRLYSNQTFILSENRFGVLSHNCPELELIRRRSYATNAASEKFEFQAETKSLLNIVAKSLYSEQEVFIRELISNASDALEKRRCVELNQETKLEIPFELKIKIDKNEKTITFSDTGIGMNREELINLLGTIAKSGSKEFRESASEQQSAESIIGQFGVGFYSAFVVSDKVVVNTRKLGDNVGYTWKWDGDSSYELAENADVDVGTEIKVHIRSGDAEKFLQPETFINVVNKYSSFVTIPIYVNGELVNTMKALWMMNSTETTPEMHESFFKQIVKTHHPHLINDRPQYTVQYKTDSPINIRALLYVPSRKVSHLEFAANGQGDYGVSLYNRKVLIKAHANNLLPRFLRFLVGVVDSEDIPLNLSREMLQADLILDKIRKTLTDRIIKYFATQMNKDRVKYTDFYQGYSLFFKEGIIVETSQTVKEELAQLLLFESSNFKKGVLTSLTEYINRMQDGQNSIYFLYAPSRELAETSPYFEIFKKRNVEVIFIYEPSDEMVFLAMPQFQMKQVESVEQWAKNEGLDSTSEKNDIVRDATKREFLDWVKINLGSVKVNDIKPSTHQSEHPFMITVSGDMGAARYMLRMAEIKEMEHLVLFKPVLHVNFLHPVVKGLMKLSKDNPQLAEKIVEQVYDNALITAGLLKDSSAMVSRINQILGELLQQEKSRILTP